MSESEESRRLWRINQAEEASFPGVSRYFWIDARKSHEAELYIGAILLAALAVESGLRNYLKVYTLRKFGKDATEFIDEHLLEEMDFRKLVTMCERLGLLKSIRRDLHKIYDIRTNYTHVKISPILRKLAEENFKVKEDDFIRTSMILGKAWEDSWSVLKKAYNVLKVIFMRSGYWSGQEGQP